MDSLETRDDLLENEETNELDEEFVETNEANNETENTTTAIVNTDNSPQSAFADPTIEELAKNAALTITKQVASGETSFAEAAQEFVEAGATAKAAAEHGEEYAKIKHKQLKEKMEANASSAAATRTTEGNKENEAFYARYRPVLEFDFSHITGDGRKKQEDRETKSYSKFLMVLTLLIATIPYLVIALILYVFKGVNSIVELISQFTVAARKIIITFAILVALYIVYMVVAYFVEFYTGVQLPML